MAMPGVTVVSPCFLVTTLVVRLVIILVSIGLGISL